MSIYNTYTQKTIVNLQGVPGRRYLDDGSATEAISPGDLVKTVTAVSGNTIALLAAADIHTNPIRLADEVDLGVTETRSIDDTSVLTYALGDYVNTLLPSQDDMWSFQCYNSGAETTLTAGSKIILSPTQDGKVEAAGTIDATTVGGTVLGQTLKDQTLAAASSTLIEAMFIRE